MIAGCLNQAKRIVESYDEVLYGPPPEKLVETTHKAIADLLVSEEARAFLGSDEDASPSPHPARERFIKKIIESISPIIPISIQIIGRELLKISPSYVGGSGGFLCAVC